MDVKNYLNKYQPLIYNSFINAYNSNRISHSYLLIGEIGIPLKESAIFLAKSLLCPNQNPFACNECPSCLKVDKNEHLNLIIIDGEQIDIKKEQIGNITSKFSLTPRDSGNKTVYIINLIENANDSSLNSLLKFLEEPAENVYAILTTNNVEKVLPTIVSRSQKLNFNLIPRKEIINNSNKDIPLEDRELLSYFYNNIDLIEENFNDEKYLEFKNLFNTFLNNILLYKKSLYLVETKFSKVIKTKSDALFFLNFLISFLFDVMNFKYNKAIYLTKYNDKIKEFNENFNDAEKILIEIMNLKSKILMNVNIVSILEHLIIYINSKRK